ncbi:MAG: hypothetical protein Tsb009_34850 [Planctomycetaceae bacterium]
MGPTASLILFALATPSIEVNTLQGEQHTGTLQKINSTSLEIDSQGKASQLPLKDLMLVSFPKATPPANILKEPIVVELTEGSRILCANVSVTRRKADLESPTLGKISVPLSIVASIRFSTKDSSFDAKWKELCKRSLKKDYLVIAKPPTLDHLDGVVGDMTSEEISFSLGDNTVPVKRPRVFGIIYAPKEKPSLSKAVCRADLTDSNSLQLSSLTWDGTKLNGKLLTGNAVELPVSTLRTLDFSLGKVRYLSDMEPREVKFTSLYNDPSDELLFKYRRNRTFENKPLQLGEKKYARGLWIYPRTYLKYRLGKEYRRFQAILGIDANARGNGNAHITISGDGKVLLEADVKKGDKPRVVDLPVANYRELEILVDFGQDKNNAGDHLDLVEARIIK